MEKSLNELFKTSIQRNWALSALCDYHGDSYTYGDVAATIARYHTTWQLCGYEPGFKVAICGRNCANWAISFLACVTYGAVPVPLLNDYAPSTIHHLVNHSEAKLLIAGPNVAQSVDPAQMPGLDAIIKCDSTHELLFCRNDMFRQRILDADKIYSEHYPHGIEPQMLDYYHHQPDELCVISYTSGTTSDPKGVMIPERALWSNMAFAREVLHMLKPGMKVVSMLPTAHLYGMSFEFLYEFVVGMEITFLVKTPSPNLILQSLADKKPDLIVVVPLLIEKIVQRGILQQYNSPKMKAMRQIPLVRGYINRKFRDGLMKALGGNFYEVIIGGSALNPEIEAVLKELEFPFTVGYGMTECAPIIGYCDWHTFAPQSCGKAAPRMEVKILSNDPQRVPGEIVTRGMNVMLGYYKNEEATRAAIDADGWLHTGDMGVVDSVGNIFIRGRIKNMMLGASGQNIYPEEIEAEVNMLPYVSESVLVQRERNRLVALVYPDRALAASEAGLNSDEAILANLNRHKAHLNKRCPAYAQVSAFELVAQEFEKTPKKSIKRFLYS